MSSDHIPHGLNVRRDADATVLLGPLRLLVTTIGTLLLLRVVLMRSGLEVIGLWSLLNIVLAFASLMDVGFSQLLAREIHVTDDRGKSVEHLLDKRSIEQAYRILLWCVLLPATLLIAWLIPSIPYDRTRFAVSLMMIAWSALVQLQGKLEAAVLAAYQDNAHVQVVNTACITVSLAVAIAGACLDAPLEGFALGTLLSAGLVRFLLRRRTASRDMCMTHCRMSARDSLQRLVRLAKAGGHFYSMSIGSTLREPCFRIIISSLLGVKALGAYAIGFRASATTRDSVAGGFNVLYPALASLYRTGNREDIASMQAGAMIFLISLGSVALGCLYGFVEPVFSLFLGSLPDGVVNATRILVVWNLITLFNIPFDYLLQATGHEKVSAASLWVHTLAILLIWPLQGALNVDLNDLLVYWTATSLITQMIIFYYVQTRLQGFWPIMRMRQVSATLLLSLIYWAVIAIWVPHVREPAGSFRQFAVLAQVLLPASAFFIASTFIVSRKTLLAHWRTH